MPVSCPGVDPKILNPRNTWADNDAYDVQARRLRDLFRSNFEEKGFARLGIAPIL
jgi:phosphoenolpyruvate carboxykinase (ATP)